MSFFLRLDLCEDAPDPDDRFPDLRLFRERRFISNVLMMENLIAASPPPSGS
jgi:hypothetical protein